MIICNRCREEIKCTDKTNTFEAQLSIDSMRIDFEITISEGTRYNNEVPDLHLCTKCKKHIICKSAGFLPKISDQMPIKISNQQGE